MRLGPRWSDRGHSLHRIYAARWSSRGTRAGATEKNGGIGGLFSAPLEQQPARIRGVNFSSFGDSDDGHSGDQGTGGTFAPVRNPRDTSESWGTSLCGPSQLRRAHVSVQILVHYGSPLARDADVRGPVQATPVQNAKRRPRTYTLVLARAAPASRSALRCAAAEDVDSTL
ncbi:hypothetical protein DFH09DRAFT_1482543 [Mycena vulgaris]|nr:hypothetical protein DFH09DRAFT_1482543 [Mycena vulgaris]